MNPVFKASLEVAATLTTIACSALLAKGAVDTVLGNTAVDVYKATPSSSPLVYAPQEGIIIGLGGALGIKGLAWVVRKVRGI